MTSYELPAWVHIMSGLYTLPGTLKSFKRFAAYRVMACPCSPRTFYQVMSKLAASGAICCDERRMYSINEREIAHFHNAYMIQLTALRLR